MPAISVVSLARKRCMVAGRDGCLDIPALVASGLIAFIKETSFLVVSWLMLEGYPATRTATVD
jgi:hypothetical protein